jgi:hypothetical protein
VADHLVCRRGGRAVKAQTGVTIRQVARARELMKDGYSMRQAAVELGVRSCDLDQTLWLYLGTDVEAVIADKPQPRPMF